MLLTLFILLYGPQVDVKMMTQAFFSLIGCLLPLVLATTADRPLFDVNDKTPPSGFGICI